MMTQNEISKEYFFNLSEKIKTTEVIENRYQITNICLGQGAFGKVYACLDQSTKSICAIKQISKAALLSKINTSEDKGFVKAFFIKSIRNQAEIMTKLEHENIIRFYRRHENQHKIYFVLEYCNQGTLQERLSQQKRIDFQAAFPIMKKIVKACKYMHKNGIFHRDIKPENILMSAGEPKLSDFGFAVDIEEVDKDQFVWAGTSEFMAPEVLRKEEITLKSDVWSLGVTFYRMLCGKLPWTFNSKNQLQTILNTPISFPANIDFPLCLQKIISNMLEVNHKKRPSMDLINDYFNF